MNVAEDRPLLSKAVFVVETIIDFAGYGRESQFVEVARMTIVQKDKVFNDGYKSLIEALFPELAITVLDKRRVGDYHYQYVYDLIKKTFLA